MGRHGYRIVVEGSVADATSRGEFLRVTVTPNNPYPPLSPWNSVPLRFLRLSNYRDFLPFEQFQRLLSPLARCLTNRGTFPRSLVHSR
jgi:hypothetical protein